MVPEKRDEICKRKRCDTRVRDPHCKRGGTRECSLFWIESPRRRARSASQEVVGASFFALFWISHNNSPRSPLLCEMRVKACKIMYAIYAINRIKLYLFWYEKENILILNDLIKKETHAYTISSNNTTTDILKLKPSLRPSSLISWIEDAFHINAEYVDF